MPYKLAEPIPLESVNRYAIDSFTVDLQSLKFNYVLGMYMDAARVRTKTIEVPQSDLIPIMAQEINGETMYAAMKRMLYDHAIAAGHIPADAYEEAAIKQTKLEAK